MGTAANVLVGATGKIYGGPTGTTLPTSDVDALDGAFVDLGYISEAGVVQAIARDTNPIKAWGGDVVRKIPTSHDLTYKFTMIETNPETLEAYYGAQDDPSTVVELKAQDGLRQAWVIDVVDGDKLVRIAIPDGEVLEVGDVTYATEDAIGYEITVSCYADVDGNKAYKYVTDASIS